MSQLPEPAAVPEPVSPDETVAQPVGATEPSPADSAMSPHPDTAPPPAIAPPLARLIIAIVLGAGLAVFGGFILGEYPFTGLTPYIAGVLFALVIAEVILSISRRHDRVTAIAAAVATAFGLGLAVWISIGEGIDPLPIGAWLAVIIGVVVALARGGLITGSSRATSNPPPS